jgi:hypothetical protein
VSWRRLYQSCVLEANPIKLQKLVFQLEDAIVLRYHDLAGEPNGSHGLLESEELQAIRRAAERLLQLKTEMLGWPHRRSPALAALPASIPASMPVSMPASVNEVKQPLNLGAAWRTVVSRTQAALLVTQRAWQNWVFKSLK